MRFCLFMTALVVVVAAPACRVAAGRPVIMDEIETVMDFAGLVATLYFCGTLLQGFWIVAGRLSE